MIERYQTEDMSRIWGEEAKFARWTRVEIAACEAFHARGEIADDEIEKICWRTCLSSYPSRNDEFRCR